MCICENLGVPIERLPPPAPRDRTAADAATVVVYYHYASCIAIRRRAAASAVAARRRAVCASHGLNTLKLRVNMYPRCTYTFLYIHVRRIDARLMTALPHLLSRYLTRSPR